MMVEKDADNHWHCTYHRKLQLLPNITKRQDRQGKQWIGKKWIYKQMQMQQFYRH